MNNLLNHGIVEVATLIPNEVKIANPKFNVDEMLRLLEWKREKFWRELYEKHV